MIRGGCRNLVSGTVVPGAKPIRQAYEWERARTGVDQDGGSQLHCSGQRNSLKAAFSEVITNGTSVGPRSASTSYITAKAGPLLQRTEKT